MSTKDDSHKCSVTVVIPVHNNSETIYSCLKSVFDQSQPPIQVICVFDACNDGSQSVVNSIPTRADIQLDSYEIQKMNSAKARNFGLSKSLGCLIAFLDADDLWDNEKLRTQTMHLSCKEKTIIGTYSEYIDFRNQHVGNSMRFKTLYRLNKRIFYDYSMPFNLSTWMLSKDKLLSMGGFDPNYRFAQDHELFFRLLREGFRVKLVTKDLAKYRIGPNSVTTNNYLDQYLFAKYAIDLTIHNEYSLSEYLQIKRSKFSSDSRKAQSGRLIRVALLELSNRRYTRSITTLAKAFIFSPLHTISKFRNLR